MDKKVVLSKTKNQEINDDFQYVVVDGKVIINEYSGTNKEVVIPSEINGCEVTEIAPFAFKGAKFESIILPNSLEIINYGAFTECELKNLVIPASVKQIGETAFKNCQNLLTVYIDGENLKQLPKQVFESCVKLISVSFGAKCAIDTICELAFCFCNRLTRIELPQSIQIIETKAFQDCVILSEVIFSSEQVIVSQSAFDDCKFDVHHNKNIILKTDPFRQTVKEVISDLGAEGIGIFLLVGWIIIVIIFGILALIFGWI